MLIYRYRITFYLIQGLLIDKTTLTATLTSGRSFVKEI